MSWCWLHNHGKTPADLGLPWSRVDPAWRNAMQIIDHGYEDQMRILRESR